MSSALPIVFTRHAEMMIVERDIDRDWIEQTVRDPNFIRPDPIHGDAARAFPAIPERQNRILRVAYRRTAKEIIVITAFFDRGQRTTA